MLNFNLPALLQESLAAVGFHTPTPIQKKAIPLVLAGRDVLGSAQTGTGKTGAFVIPVIAKILESSAETALILTPTRELAAQVMKVVHDLIPRNVSGIKTALLIGGAHMKDQLRDLKKNPRIIVGTPGRVNDHLKRQTLNLQNAAFLVLDETDRMLDMGFGIQLDAIIKFMPNERQTLMFSATLPDGIIKLSDKYLNQPERIAIGETHRVALNIEQDMLHVKHSAKYPQLIKELDHRQGSVIIFVKTKRGADELVKQLSEDFHQAVAIHGDLRQRDRDRVIKNFRKQSHRVLVATDVAARGLDIPHIEHVINYDLPQSPEDYIHRIGRTARAGSSGSAMSFVSPSEGAMWKEILKLLQGQQGGKLPPQLCRENKERNPDKKQAKSKKFGFKDKKKFARSDAPVKSKRKFGDSDFTGESKPKFGRSDFAGKSKRKFGDSDFVGESKPKFGRSDSVGKSKRKFGDSDFAGESKPKFGRSDSAGKSKRKFEESDFAGKPKKKLGYSGFTGKSTQKSRPKQKRGRAA